MTAVLILIGTNTIYASEAALAHRTQVLRKVFNQIKAECQKQAWKNFDKQTRKQEKRLAAIKLGQNINDLKFIRWDDPQREMLKARRSSVERETAAQAWKKSDDKAKQQAIDTVFAHLNQEESLKILHKQIHQTGLQSRQALKALKTAQEKQNQEDIRNLQLQADGALMAYTNAWESWSRKLSWSTKIRYALATDSAFESDYDSDLASKPGDAFLLVM